MAELYRDQRSWARRRPIHIPELEKSTVGVGYASQKDAVTGRDQGCSENLADSISFDMLALCAQF